MCLPRKEQNTDIEKIKKRLEEKESVRQAKAEHKITKKENKNNEKNKKLKIKKKTKWFNFFTKWFFIGIILVLISICISMFINSVSNNQILNMLKPLLTIISGILSTLGIALFVGCVFDFSKNSEAFVSFVSNILSDIVVSKKFLSTLSVKDKEQALNLILKPMDSQVEQYANINDYFKKKINESMTMFDANFKSNVVLNIEAYTDNKKNIVFCKTTITYTIYKLNNKYQPIKVMLEKDGSELDDLVVITPNGEKKIDTGNAETECIGGIDYKIHVMNIPEEYEKYDHLKIQRVIIEPGHDHWIHYIWQSLTPYEGITCIVKCLGDLSIKDYMIFDNKAYYYTKLSGDKKQLDISSSQWLDADTGFSFVIGKDNSANNENLQI